MNLIAYDGQIELDEDDWADDYEPEEDDDYEDQWECCFPDRCLMPSYNHMRSECYTREMAEAWMDEQQNNPA